MRLALVHINPVVGDIEGNERLIAGWIARAREERADLAVFPELALCGYPPKDLLLQEGFLDAAVAAAKRLARDHTAGITVVFGTPLPLLGEHADTTNGAGPIVNSLLAYRDGVLLAAYDKRLLPTYDVFDENRYFTPGGAPAIIDVAGVRVGLSICEDLWRGEDVGFDQRYADLPDPVAQLVTPPDGSAGAQLVINPSASPFVLGKERRHRDLLRKHAVRHGVHVAAVNQVGGNDDLIFDGHAAAFAPSGELIAASRGFEEGVTIAEIGAGGAAPPSGVADPFLAMPEEERLYRALVLGTRDYLRKTGFRTAVLGLSGGIDSAVTAVVAAAALGPQNVLGVSLPSRYSSPGSKTDAADLAARLGMPFTTIPIEEPFAAMERTLAPAFAGREPGLAEENIQSRLRGAILMALSNKLGHLLLTTGNKTEMAVGYATLYGDMNGGLAVLSDVTKMMVYRLARWMNDHPGALGLPGGVPPIPEATITKPPSAELRPDQTDQDSLPPYPLLDEVVRRSVELRQHPRRIINETGYDAATVARIVRMINVNEFKRKQAATGLKVTSVAFGTGRRVPIAQGWRPERGMA